MNNIKHILKIEVEKNIVLFSENVKQQIMLNESEKLKRNLNFDVIFSETKETKIKYKSIIESTDPPNLLLLKTNKVFTIHSIVNFREFNMSTPSIPFVQDSVVTKDNYIEYCPIFQMALLNFKYKSENNYWLLEFEEI
jgi:hypothetical protein